MTLCSVFPADSRSTTLRPWSHRRPDSTKLASSVITAHRALWSLNWPVYYSWVWRCGHSENSTQLDKIRHSSVFCQLLNSQHVQNFTTDCKLQTFCQVEISEWSQSPTQLNSTGQFSDHSARWQLGRVRWCDHGLILGHSVMVRTELMLKCVHATQASGLVTGPLVFAAVLGPNTSANTAAKLQ